MITSLCIITFRPNINCKLSKLAICTISGKIESFFLSENFHIQILANKRANFPKNAILFSMALGNLKAEAKFKPKR